MNGYLGAMCRYGSFRGRASRVEFWGFSVMAVVVIFVAIVIDATYISGPGSKSAPFAGLVVLGHLLPTLAVSVRRLHDTDRSGWLLLINIIPLIGTLLLVIWACEAGTAGTNRFGPDPQSGRATPFDYEPISSPRPAPRDLIAEIERLAQLKASGSLTEAEFEVLKAQALGRG